MDLTASIRPKSDQINADDLMAGPVTVTVADVVPGSDEQPVNVQLVEFPGRPYRPSKSMRRVMVAAWGKEASAYAGRRMTLFRNGQIKFGRDEVGGIQISHLSDLNGPLKTALTVTRGKRSLFTVQPLVEAQAAPAPPPPLTQLFELMKRNGMDEREPALAFLSTETGRDITSTSDLTPDEIAAVLATLAQKEPA